MNHSGTLCDSAFAMNSLASLCFPKCALVPV